MAEESINQGGRPTADLAREKLRAIFKTNPKTSAKKAAEAASCGTTLAYEIRREVEREMRSAGQ